jgi:hypothetical protein
MGTDIHGGFIKRCNTTNTNTSIKTNWEQDRDYLLFAILAGVRNGYGFAGCYRHEPLKPIAEGRGLPEWLHSDDEEYCSEMYNPWYGSDWGKDEKEFGCWLGDHSHTHMTLDEILNWEGWDNYLERGGILTKEHYLKTLAVGKEPEAWCGLVSGGNTKTVREVDFKIGGTESEVTHVECKWVSEETLREMYTWWLEEILRIKSEHLTQEEDAEIYLIVGFDS